MLFQYLLVVDIHALDSAQLAIEDTILQAPYDLSCALCEELFSCLSNSDDYVRKHSLVRWYQQLMAALAKTKQCGGDQEAIATL